MRDAIIVVRKLNDCVLNLYHKFILMDKYCNVSGMNLCCSGLCFITTSNRIALQARFHNFHEDDLNP